MADECREQSDDADFGPHPENIQGPAWVSFINKVLLNSNNIKVIKQLWFQECRQQSYHMIHLLHALIASEAASDWNLYSL